jgi:hypothetical protein
VLVENGAKCSPCLVGVAANIWGFGPPATVGILLAAPDIRIGGDSRLLPSAFSVSLADDIAAELQLLAAWSAFFDDSTNRKIPLP